MSKTVIKIENLSKIYRLGEVGTGTISHDLNRWWKMNILGQDDPYAKIGHVNDRTQKAEKGEMVAALRDINLEVKEGEVLGIIGKNGAGKSTLLKILSRVTSPTSGSIKVSGRMASLLEVGTGFHPDMTGRENIYMNGTIMGMRKWEITKKLDEIVEFAGVAKYLDTPVKRYSSGMTVRLGFAIAAHLEPEILIVDEVLAVGDAEFQKKAIGKMQDVSKNHGKTVLFVSHNLTTIRTLCENGILLKNGEIESIGKIDAALNRYLEIRRSTSSERLVGDNRVEIKNIQILNKKEEYEIFERIIVEFEIHIKDKNKFYQNTELFIVLYNNEDEPICSYFSKDFNIMLDIKNGQNIKISYQLNLKPGIYYISIGLFDKNRIFLDWIKYNQPLNIIGIFHESRKTYDNRIGNIYNNKEGVTFLQ